MQPSTDPLESYTFIKELRAGGEGKALLYKKDNTKYVVKQRIFNTLNEANQGLREAWSLAKVDHPNIVKFEDAVIHSKDNQIYLSIVMEYCQKGDLLDLLIDLVQPTNHHTVTLGSELSTLNLGTLTHETTSDIDTRSISSTSSTGSANSDIRSNSDNSTSTPPNNSTSPISLTNISSVIKQPSQQTLLSTTPRDNNNNNNNNKSPKEKKKCVIKMTIDLTKSLVCNNHHTQQQNNNNNNNNNNKTSQLNLLNNLSPSPSLNHLEEQILHSDQIKKTVDSIYLIEQNQLMSWLLDISFGVQAIHKTHMIHRDLKSENCFISSSNQLKIGDLGLATFSNHSTVHKGAIGTYTYSAPEVLESKPYDKSADIFSLGCIFFELITLKLLSYNRIYIGEDLINDQFDSMKFLSYFSEKYSKLAPLVLSMIDKNPNLRPSIDIVIQRLQSIDTSTLRERISIKRVNSFKGLKKQLDRAHFEEAAYILASSLVTDPRFSCIFPPSDPQSIPHLQYLFKYILKVLSGHRCSIWAYYGIDGKMLSVAVWLNPDKKKEVRVSDRIKGSLNLATKIGLKKVGQGIELMKFVDSILQTENKSPHWFLAYIGTLQDYRGNGIGSYLCENILEWSDHSNVPCKTLVFTKSSLEFFRKLGFEVSKEVDSKSKPKHIENVWVLIRKQQSLNQ